MEQQQNWQKMPLNQKVNILTAMTVKHELALKEFGSMVSMMSQILEDEGLLIRNFIVKNGKKLTSWKIKSRNREITIIRK